MFDFNRDRLRDIVFSMSFLKKIYANRRKDLLTISDAEHQLEQAETVLLESTNRKFRVGLVKDCIDYPGFVKKRAYYPKFERFLKNNNIEYEYFDPYLSTWIDTAKNFNLIIWHTHSDISTQEIAKSKIYFLERKLKINCYPSYDEIWGFEDKVHSHYLYNLLDIPEIPSFITHSKKEAFEYLEKAKYPVISKVKTGSSSHGVEKLKNKSQASKYVRQVFSYKGKKSNTAYCNQKDYVLFQEYIDSATYDLRVISVGNKLLGYYRYPNKGDFRASGAGNYEKKSIPDEVLELAFKIKEKYGATSLATDFLYDEVRKKYYVIETSIFIGVDTAEQLVVDGVAGYYERVETGEFIFKPGRFWVQELALLEYFKRMKDVSDTV